MHVTYGASTWITARPVIQAALRPVLGGMNGPKPLLGKADGSPIRPGRRFRSGAMTLVQSDAPAIRFDRSAMSACIVAVAASADRGAFAVLFAHFAPRIKSYLVRLGAGAALAEEIAQETMLAVWRKARLFDPAKADAATWIFTIARNQRIDALRRERRPEIAAFELTPDQSAEPAGDDRVAALERARLLQAAIAQLPPEQAEVVRLSYFEDKPHGEIEAALGIPLGTVKSRLRLAVARLREALGDAA